jgi:hypothetical protein
MLSNLLSNPDPIRIVIFTIGFCLVFLYFPVLRQGVKKIKERADWSNVYEKKFLYDHERTNAQLDRAKAEGEYDMAVAIKWLCPCIGIIFMCLALFLGVGK